MGMNDAAEQLQVAIEVVGQLERELAKAIGERDASRQVNAEFLTARANRIVDDHEVCTTELAASLAAIDRVLNLVGDIGPEARRILTQVPADALAAHDREVAAKALDKARDNLMPSYNWNLDPYTGNERPGTSAIDELYGDVHREMSEAAAEYRAVSE